MNYTKGAGASLQWILLPILFSSATVLASDQNLMLNADDPCLQCPPISSDPNAVPYSTDPSMEGAAAAQASALSKESDGFLEDAQETNTANVSYVGGSTRIGIGLDTEFKGRAEVTHTFSDTQNNATSGQAWVGVNPTAKKEKNEEVLTGGGVKLNHNWVSTDANGQPVKVNKIFGAYDQNQAKDKKVSVGYGQETEDMFWSGQISKGLSDKRVAATTTDGQNIYEKAYDYGVGGRVGTFVDDQLMRVQGGLDYEWGKEKAASEKTASQLTVTGGVEKFFFDSPHSIGANVEVVKEQGGYVDDKHATDVRGNLSYRYEFGGEGVYQPDQKYRRVRVEIPGKTIVTKKAPKVERKLVKHTMELESDTFFEVGKYNLTPEAQQRLSSVMARIRDSGHEGNIRITGNTCDKGTTEHNQTLSENRANAVRNFMINNGFAEQELLARGLGETSPKYPNQPTTAHKNRRVDIEYVTYETNYQDQTVQQGQEVRTQTEPQIVWRKELIQTPPTWVGQALHNNIQYKQTIDTYRTLGAAKTTVPTTNTAPVAVADAVTTTADSKVIIDVLANDTDANNDTLSISLYDPTSVKGGSVSLVEGKLSYIPAAGFTGTDTFKYTVSDGRGGTAVATVTITVNSNGTGGNHKPIAANDYATVAVDAKAMINVLANDTDADNDTLSISSFDQTSVNGGTVSLVNGQLSYMPATGFNGIDTFNYIISDGNGGTATGKVTVTVGTVTHKVTATADAITTTADAKATIDVLNNDTEATGGTLRISSFDQTSVKGGSISLASGKLSYIPAAGFTGTDTFTYTISNAAGDTDTATVTVTVNSSTASFAPDDDNYKVATADLDSQGEIALDVLTGDQYTGTVSIRITSSPSLGTISNVDASGKVTGTTVTYKPKDKTSGTDTFTYVLVDADGVVSPSATVTITLSNGGTTSLTFDAIDDGADGKDALYNFTTADFSGSIVSRTLTVLDNDIGKGLSIVAVTQPRFGTAKISSDGQSIIYTPRSGYCQSHTFTYTVRDSSGKEDTATIYINID